MHSLFHRSQRSGDLEKRPPRPKKVRSIHWLAILSFLVTATALILTILCVYAGHKPGYMEDYAIFTLNTSRIGDNLLLQLDDKIDGMGNEIASVVGKRSEPTPIAAVVPRSVVAGTPTTLITMAPRSPNIFSSLAGDISSDVHSVASEANSIRTSVETAAASKISSAAHAAATDIIRIVNDAYENVIRDFDLQDWYSLHIMATCDGEYVYNKNGSNITVGTDVAPPTNASTHKLVDSCPSHSVLDPMSLLKVFYWVGIALTALALILGVVAAVTTGPVLGMFTMIVTIFAFCFVGLASAATHGIAVGAAKLVNYIGGEMGIAGYSGSRFLALTWAATWLLVVNMVIWCCIVFIALRGR